VSEYGHGFGLAVAAGFLFQPALGGGVAAREQGGGFAEGPTQPGVADFGAAGAVGLPGGFPLALEEAAVRDEVLYMLKALDGVDFVEDDHGQDVTDAVDGLEQDDGPRVEGLSGFFEIPFDPGEQIIIEIDPADVHIDAFLDVGVGEEVAQLVAMLCVAQVVGIRRQVVLADRVMDMCNQFALCRIRRMRRRIRSRVARNSRG
jgi:hypothetical protein